MMGVAAAHPGQQDQGNKESGSVGYHQQEMMLSYSVLPELLRKASCDKKHSIGLQVESLAVRAMHRSEQLKDMT